MGIMACFNSCMPPLKSLVPFTAAAAVLCCLVAFSLSGPARGESRTPTGPQWKALSGKKIYFGHMSVGNGMMAGAVEIIKESESQRVSVMELGAMASQPLRPGTISHSDIGRNKDAISKIDAFRDIMISGLGRKVDIAVFKFCYVDIVADSDTGRIFSHYKATMDELRRKFPKVKFAHMTVPLRTVQTGWKVAVKKTLSLPVGGYADNVRRNEYNEMLRTQYGGSGRLFDLAQIESTRKDGSRAGFTTRSGAYYCLDPDMTHDGGHLNAAGRRTVANEFLIFLAGL